MIDSFDVTESYQWHDDIMEITRAIVRGTDEARLVSIADHFKADLIEIREWIEEKKKRTFAKPQTNADRIRAMSDEELADEYIRIYHRLGWYTDSWAWLRKWLKSPVEENK